MTHLNIIICHLDSSYVIMSPYLSTTTLINMMLLKYYYEYYYLELKILMTFDLGAVMQRAPFIFSVLKKNIF